MPSGDLLEPIEVALRLDCSIAHVYRLFKRGLPYVRGLGRGRRVLKADLDAYVYSLRETGCGATTHRPKSEPET